MDKPTIYAGTLKYLTSLTSRSQPIAFDLGKTVSYPENILHRKPDGPCASDTICNSLILEARYSGGVLGVFRSALTWWRPASWMENAERFGPTDMICYIIRVDLRAGRIASGREVVELEVLEMTVPAKY